MTVWNGIKTFDQMFLAPVACITASIFAISVLLENCFGIIMPLLPKFVDPRHITKSEV